MQKLRDLLGLDKKTGVARIDKVLDVLVLAVEELNSGIEEICAEDECIQQTIDTLCHQRSNLLAARIHALKVHDNILKLMGE